MKPYLPHDVIYRPKSSFGVPLQRSLRSLRAALGAGEVVANSIDRDGVMEGYDLDLITQVREAISLPMTVLGGAGALKDIADHRIY